MTYSGSAFGPLPPHDASDDDGAGATMPRRVMFHLLGCVPYFQCQDLQRRLVAHAATGTLSHASVLLAEHPPAITVGRRGSRRHIRVPSDQLKRRGVEVRWVDRGGGCVLHGPGQLAVYPVLPIRAWGWKFSQYLERFRRGLVALLNEWGVSARPTLPGAGVWGHAGAVAALGVGVTRGVTHHGAWLNVQTDLSDFPRVDIVPPECVLDDVPTTMSSLAAERRRPVTMASLRAGVIQYLSQSLDCDPAHVTTGHPLLA